MADRRMLSKQILDSDAFMDLSLQSQALYMHICLRADDEGFLNSPRKVCRMVGCSDGDLDSLVEKGFLIRFSSGIVVVKHWKIHNYIPKDRFHRTAYTDERNLLTVKDNGAYTMNTSCIQDVDNTNTEVRLGKVRINKKKDIVEKSTSSDDVSLVINHLNLRTGRSFKSNNKATMTTINARLKEGFTTKDMMDVIDKKCREWLNDPKMSQYLRPQTLFGSKFESYLNAPLSTSVKDHIVVDTPEYYGKKVEEKEASPDLIAEIQEMQKRMNNG